MPNDQSFKILNDIQHILLRPNTYIGAVDEALYNEYILENGKIDYKEVAYVPGFIKIICEFLDNCIDEAIRTNFAFANKISVSFNDIKKMITIEDNGRGIPVEQIDNEWKPKLA